MCREAALTALRQSVHGINGDLDRVMPDGRTLVTMAHFQQVVTLRMPAALTSHPMMEAIEAFRHR